MNDQTAKLRAALERLIEKAQRATEADEPIEFSDIDEARQILRGLA